MSKADGVVCWECEHCIRDHLVADSSECRVNLRPAPRRRSPKTGIVEADAFWGGPEFCTRANPTGGCPKFKRRRPFRHRHPSLAAALLSVPLLFGLQVGAGWIQYWLGVKGGYGVLVWAILLGYFLGEFTWACYMRWVKGGE